MAGQNIPPEPIYSNGKAGVRQKRWSRWRRLHGADSRSYPWIVGHYKPRDPAAGWRPLHTPSGLAGHINDISLLARVALLQYNQAVLLDECEQTHLCCDQQML
jgi:hypothetical protein